eukprot:SAG11_NODE_1595_length_4611_cov_7.390957_2_plen_152_part_00
MGESQLIKADGSTDPFSCDGTLPDCVGEHDGSVVLEGPSAINMAAPLVCDVETRECLSDLCFLVDCGAEGTCVSPHGTCTCSNGYTGDRCETHTCCSLAVGGRRDDYRDGNTNSNGNCYDDCYQYRCGYCRDCLVWCDANRLGWDAQCDRN